MELLDSVLNYFLEHSLFGLLLTLVAFYIGQTIYERSNRLPFFQPVLVGIVLVTLGLLFFDISFDAYFESAEPLHMMMGPVIVALALPLYNNSRKIKSMMMPLLVTLVIAGFLVVVSAVMLAWLMGADETLLATLATKSITTPIAIAVSEKIGGLQALAAACVLLTGVIGAVLGPPILDRMGASDDVKGFTLGLTAHAIGTAKSLEISEECGAFSALAIGMMGILTSIILPMLFFFVL